MTMADLLAPPLPNRSVETLSVVRRGHWLLVQFAALQRSASWAIVGGGISTTDTVAWREVTDEELTPCLDPRRFLSSQLEELGAPNGVGLLTSRSLDSYVHAVKPMETRELHCIATVGLGNAVRVGDPVRRSSTVAGTINLLCHVPQPLSESAMLEALALATEAKTVAIHELALPSPISHEPVSGTGTDCVVVTSPYLDERSGKRPDHQPVSYIGKHTALGHLLGSTVYEATRQGARKWIQEREAGALGKNRS